VGAFIQPAQCSDLTATPQLCWLANGCYWTDGYCSGYSNNWTYTAVNPKTCSQIPAEACDIGFGCQTVCNGTAGPNCVNFPDSVTCSVYPGCYWNFTGASCYGNLSLIFDCSYISADVCTQFSGCNLQPSCSHTPCQNITTWDICEATPQCMWYLSSCLWDNPIVSGFGEVLRVGVGKVVVMVGLLLLYYV